MKLSTTNSIYEHNLTEHLSKLNQDIILNSQWKNNNDDLEKKLLEPKIKMLIEDKDTLIAYLQSKLSKYQDEIREKDKQIQQLQNEGKKGKEHSYSISILSDGSDSTCSDDVIDYKKKYYEIKEKYDSLENDHSKLIESYSVCLMKIEEDKEIINKLSYSYINKNKRNAKPKVNSNDEYSNYVVQTEPDYEEKVSHKRNSSFFKIFSNYY